MSLTKDRDTKERFDAQRLSLGVKGNALIYAGALAALNSAGLAVPTSADPTLIVIGRAETRADNTGGADGAIQADIRRGVFRFDNSAAGDAIAITDIGESCYAVDDGTVAKTSAGGTRARAGRIYDVDAQGVWVDTREPNAFGKQYLTVRASDLLSADAAEPSFVSPVAGRITAIRSALDGHVIAGADCTITAKINGVAVTTGVITHALAGSAVGERKLVNPTALNALNVGDRVSFLVGGGNTNNAAQAGITVEITL